MESRCSGGFPRFSFVPPPTGATFFPVAAASARKSAHSWPPLGTTTSDATTPSMTSGSDWVRLASEGIDAQFLGHRLHTEGADLAAHVTLREDLLGIEKAGRVETLFQSGHSGQVISTEDQGHIAALLSADTVLARERSTDFDAVADDLFAGLEDSFGRTGYSAIEEHQRVKVAIARVEDVGDGELEVT